MKDTKTADVVDFSGEVRFIYIVSILSMEFWVSNGNGRFTQFYLRYTKTRRWLLSF